MLRKLSHLRLIGTSQVSHRQALLKLSSLREEQGESLQTKNLHLTAVLLPLLQHPRLLATVLLFSSKDQQVMQAAGTQLQLWVTQHLHKPRPSLLSHLMLSSSCRSPSQALCSLSRSLQTLLLLHRLTRQSTPLTAGSRSFRWMLRMHQPAALHLLISHHQRQASPSVFPLWPPATLPRLCQHTCQQQHQRQQLKFSRLRP